MALAAELSRVLSTFEGHGIPALPFKGPVLSAILYGSVSGRQFEDLDLLVPPDDVGAAIELLLQSGFAERLHLSDHALAGLVRSRNELSFVHRAHGVSLELQWQVTPAYFSWRLQIDELWKRRARAMFGGTYVNSLSPEDHLLVLCIHGAKHVWFRLGWVRDVAQLISGPTAIDWRAVQRRASAEGGERLFRLALFLALKYGGATVSSEMRDYVLRDDRVPHLAAEIRRVHWTAAPIPPRLGPTSWFLLRARERWRDRGRYCARLAFHLAPDDLQVQLSPRLWGLRYALRPLRLASKYGRHLLRGRR